LINQMVDAYLQHLEMTGYSHTTIESYGRILRAMVNGIQSKYAPKTPLEVKGFMVENFVHSMENISDRTTNYYITIIKLFFEYLEEAGYIDRNPSNVLKKVKVVVDDDTLEENLDNKAYSDKEVVDLMKSCGGRNQVRDRAIIAMLSGTGLRASELCGLTVGDWRNMQRSHIYVKRKGGAFRWVAVAGYVHAFVEEYLESRKGIDESSPLFASVNGNPLSRQDLYKILRRRQEKAGIKPGVHIFRHTFLTGTSKVSNAKIAQSLGNHSDFSTTKRYIHTTAEERMAAVNNTAWAEQLEQTM
jgi:site-specific recombinase XerD